MIVAAVAFFRGIWGRLALIALAALSALALFAKIVRGAKRAQAIEGERDTLVRRVERIDQRRQEAADARREIDRLDRDALVDRLRGHGKIRDD